MLLDLRSLWEQTSKVSIAALAQRSNQYNEVLVVIKNQAVTGFPFTLVNKTTGAAVVAGVATGYYLLDGGAQGAIAGVPVHEGNGQWSVDLLAGETDGDVVGLLFTHADAVPVHFTIFTDTRTIGDVAGAIGTPVALDGGLGTIAGMLTKMADDNDGGDFDATTDSLYALAGAIDTVDSTVTTINNNVGTAVALDGGLATIGGMLTKIADDNGGADFNAGTDSLHEQTHQIIDIDGIVDDLKTDLGAPIVLDGALQTIAGMITALADDNGGADFNRGTDSLHEQSHQLATIDGNVDDVETLLGTVDGKIDTVDGIVDDLETMLTTGSQEPRPVKFEHP